MCGPRNGAANCWCDDLPPVRPRAEASDCLCPGCLQAAVFTRQAANAATAGSSPVAGTDYYVEGAAIVFTAHYHLRRGMCCGNGCRHCPYTG
jgi:hypothetical protein